MISILKRYPDNMMISNSMDFKQLSHLSHWGLMPLMLGILVMMLISQQAMATNLNSQKASKALLDEIAEQQQWYQSSRQQQYQPLNGSTLIHFITLLQQSFATTNANPLALQPSSNHERLTEQWQNSGWQWQYKTQQAFVRLQPAAPSMSGQGAFLLRQQDQSKPLGRGQIALLIQAPHRFYDTHTGQIALLLSTDSNVQALAWNTVPRYQNKDPRSLSDLAHQPNSVFALFAVQFALQNPTGRVIQLHGFSADKRDTEAAKNSQIIVSSGTVPASDSARKVAQCLSEHIQNVSLYGKDVQELGGTRNSTGQQLRKLSFTGFIHLEMSLPLRKKLLEDGALRQQFARCLSA